MSLTGFCACKKFSKNIKLFFCISKCRVLNILNVRLRCFIMKLKLFLSNTIVHILAFTFTLFVHLDELISVIIRHSYSYDAIMQILQ